MLELADVVAINKFDRRGADDAYRQVCRQWSRDHRDEALRNRVRAGVRHHRLPVQRRRHDRPLPPAEGRPGGPRPAGHRAGCCRPPRSARRPVRRPWCPPDRHRYLAEIAASVRGYHATTVRLADEARRAQQLDAVVALGTDRGVDVGTAPGPGHRPRRRRGPDAAGACWTSGRQLRATYLDDGPEAVRPGGPVGRPRPHLPVRHPGPPGGPAPRRRPRRPPALAALRAPAGALPLHGGRLPLQARRRGPGPHVRRRGRRLPHQPPLPPAGRGAARHPAVHRVRLGDPLRPRPRRASRHPREDRHLGRLHRHPGRHGGPLRRLRPVRPDHLGVDDHQRAGPHHPGHVPQRGRSTNGSPGSRRSTAGRRPGRRRTRCPPRCSAPFGARCRRTS